MSRLRTESNGQPVDLMLPVPQDVNTRSRFHYLQRPQVAPANCAICGSVNRPVIDFQMQVEFYGAVYFCVECIVAAAMVTGKVVTVEKHTELINAYTDLLSKIDTKKEIIDEYLVRCDQNLDRLISDLATAVPSNVSVDADSVKEDAGEPEPISSGPDPTFGQVSLFTFGEGPFSLSDDTSDESDGNNP